jgi:uncharacterized membrane protein YeiH
MTLDTLSFWLAIAATIAFAVTAVLAVADHGVDIFGVIVLGVITAVGGGTMRDLILGEPVFWASHLIYVEVAILASIAAFVGRSFFTQPQVFILMLYLDGVGAALFGMQGALKTWELGFGGSLAAIMLGVITAIGGGLLRDVLAGRKTLLMSSEIYAIPVVIGSSVLVLLLGVFPDHHSEVVLLCAFLTFMMRVIAIHWHLQVPACLITKSKKEQSSRNNE